MTTDEIFMKLIGGALVATIIIIMLLGRTMWTVVLPGIDGLWLLGVI